MNILQMEDQVKGIPDQQLMQAAQNPDGQIPQFLLVSEVQRRGDMRKRYQQDQAKMPEGTITDKIMNEGIMGLQPQQQQMPQGMPQQQMPQGMPQGTPQQQMPQQQTPQGMASGGVVSLAGGGTAGMASTYNPYDIDMGAYNQLIAQGFSSDEAMNALHRAGTLDMGGPPDGSLGGDLTQSQIDWQGSNDPRLGQMAPYQPPQPGDARYPSIHAGLGDTLSRSEEAAALKDKSQSDWYDPLVTGIATVANLGPLGHTEEFRSDKTRAMADAMGGAPVDHTEEFRSDETRTLAESMRNAIPASTNEPQQNTILAQDVEKDDLSGLKTLAVQGEYPDDELNSLNEESLGITGLAAAPRNLSTSKINQADGAIVKGQTMGAEGPPSELDEWMAQQRRAAVNNALMQFGAGIAGGDIGGGISRAGDAMAEGQRGNDAYMIYKMQQEGQDRRDVSRQEGEDRRLDKTLEQRKAEARMGSADSAKMRESKWFLDQPKARQDILSRYAGRSLPEDTINKLVSEEMVKSFNSARELGTEPMTDQDRINMTNMLRGQYGLQDIEGGGADIMAQARNAIAQGKPRDAVVQRLIELGVPEETARGL